MLEERYKRAYTEVLAVIDNLSKDERSKIPEYRIEFFKRNCAKDYDFTIDVSKEDYELSREAYAIIVSIFMDYFLNEKQAAGIMEMLVKNN